MIHSEQNRINWIDQLKGFGIILVIYGHNLPVIESYIYSFHMPLFFFIGGLFHPSQINFKTVKKRAKQILGPYFLWSFLLFLFWFFIGSKFGDSVILKYSSVKHFLGIFLAQGDHEYMSWGVPMWFLPSIFLTFLCFGFVRRLKNIKHQILTFIPLICIGFFVPRVLKAHVIWSIDVSLVALFFYASAFYLKQFITKELPFKYQNLTTVLLLIAHVLCSLFLIVKVDMFRSIYSNELLFLLNASVGICFWLLVFKKIKKIGILTFFGQNTIPVLAMHLRALTVIKLFLILFWISKSFNFNEVEKIILVILQLAIMYPAIILINKYVPILNGKKKAFESRN
jgi:acyltransferase